MAESRLPQADGKTVAAATGGLQGLRWRRLGFGIVASLAAGFPWTMWYYIYTLGGPSQQIALSPTIIGPIAGVSILLVVGVWLRYWSFAQKRMPEVTAVGLYIASRNLFSRRTVREIRWAELASFEIGFQSTPAAPPAYRRQSALLRIALKDGRRQNIVLAQPSGALGRQLDGLVNSAKESWLAYGSIEGGSRPAIA